jgi:hypothetical protein
MAALAGCHRCHHSWCPSRCRLAGRRCPHTLHLPHPTAHRLPHRLSGVASIRQRARVHGAAARVLALPEATSEVVAPAVASGSSRASPTRNGLFISRMSPQAAFRPRPPGPHRAQGDSRLDVGLLVGEQVDEPGRQHGRRTRGVGDDAQRLRVAALLASAAPSVTLPGPRASSAGRRHRPLHEEVGARAGQHHAAGGGDPGPARSAPTRGGARGGRCPSSPGRPSGSSRPSGPSFLAGLPGGLGDGRGGGGPQLLERLVHHCLPTSERASRISVSFTPERNCSASLEPSRV